MENVVNSYNTAGLQCPNLGDNRLMIKFVNPDRIGVVFGPRLMGCLCLKGFFELIDKFLTTTIVIPSGETQRLELGNVSNYGYRRDTWVYDATSFLSAEDTIDGFLGIPAGSESFSFTSGTTVTQFAANLRAAINASTFLKANFEVSATNTTTNTFTLRTINVGKAMTSSFFLGTTPIPGTQSWNHIRYPRGRCKFIFIVPDYDEFTEPIPATNKKHVHYAYDDNYSDNLLTPENIVWRKISKLYANSSDNDLDETDTNMIETIWLKNDLDYDVTMQVLLAS